jgi:acetoacetyl-CoA synthetase
MPSTADAAVVWVPPAGAVRDAELTRFAHSVGLGCDSYDRLHRWSVGNLEAFWSQFTTFAGIVGDLDGPVVVRDPEAPMTSARFFPDAHLNFAENLLVGDADHVAVVEAGEAGIKHTLSRGALRQEVARVQRGFLGLGLQPGDRVASVLPNTAESLVALLAATAIGAIWSTCAPEFGLTGLRDRFGQTAPRMLIGASSYVYNGVTHSLTDRLSQLTRELDAVEWLVMTGGAAAADAACPVYRLADFGDDTAAEPIFPQLPFDHPLYINFTSGTTGLPKCILHRAGGVLLQHRKEHTLHCDIKTGDRVFYYSNTGWMMYHWLVSALASGAALVLYDGAAIPRKDDGGRDHGVLWRLAEDIGVTHFGTSPKYFSILQRDGYDVRERHRLDSLRMIMSAGAPLTPEHFYWVYEAVKDDVCLASISGGTEILGCFVMGNPVAPVRAGEIQCKALGMAVQVMDERNSPLVGRTGDLVCTEPFPSMPLGFWGKGGWQRYLGEYFADRREIWTHGDYAESRPAGGFVIHGRTDTLLKPGGVRIGTAEIYRVVDRISGIADSVVAGRTTDDDMEVWLFVVPEEGVALDESLADQIRQTLRREATPRHVPHRIIQVPAVPYTLTGKKVEKAVMQVLVGEQVSTRGSMENPEALDALAVAIENAS